MKNQSDFLSCKICFESYNSADRKPLQLPCYHTACRLCLVDLEGGNGSITCFKCREVQQGTVYGLKPNQALLEAVEEMPIGMEDFIRQSEVPSRQILMCTNHPSKEATIYCENENVQICGDCVVSHLKHSESLKEYDHSEFIKNVKSNIDLLQKEVETLNEKISHIKEMQESYSKILEIPKLSSDKMLQIEEDFEKICLDNSLNFKNVRRNTSEIISTILSNENITILINFLEEMKVSPEPIQRGTRDGFQASDFHRLCDNQGATVVVVKPVEFTDVIGGFCETSWLSNDKSIHGDKALLFNLSRKTKHKSIPNTKSYQFKYDYSAIFQGLVIINNSNTSNGSWCNMSSSQQKQFENLNQNSLLEGQHNTQVNFTVKDIEVFKVSL